MVLILTLSFFVSCGPKLCFGPQDHCERCDRLAKQHPRMTPFPTPLRWQTPRGLMLRIRRPFCSSGHVTKRFSLAWHQVRSQTKSLSQQPPSFLLAQTAASLRDVKYGSEHEKHMDSEPTGIFLITLPAKPQSKDLDHKMCQVCASCSETQRDAVAPRGLFLGVWPRLLWKINMRLNLSEFRTQDPAPVDTDV